MLKDYSSGLMHECAIAASRNGMEPNELDRLFKNQKLLSSLLGVLRNTHTLKVEPNEWLIDCDANPPMVPCVYTIKEHIQTGKYVLDFSKIKFYISENQNQDPAKIFIELRRELKNKNIKMLDGNVLCFLSKNKHLIPEEWKKQGTIPFLGTIYGDSDNNPQFGCLVWDSSASWWRVDGLPLDRYSFAFNHPYPAVIM